MAGGKSPWARMDAVVVLLAFAMVALLAWWLAPGKTPAFSSPGVMTTLIDNRLLIGVLRATGVIVLIYATASVAMLLKDRVLITKAAGMEASKVVQTVEETAAVLVEKDKKIAALVTEVGRLRERVTGDDLKVNSGVDVVEHAQQQTEQTVQQLQYLLGVARIRSAPRGVHPRLFEEALLEHLLRTGMGNDGMNEGPGD